MTATAMNTKKIKRHRDIVFPICNTLFLILVMKYSDTIDVFVMIYSFGGSRPHYAYGVAAGMFKSLVGILLLLGANRIAKLLDEETLI